MINYCINCGAQHEAGARFCILCGKPYDTPQTTGQRYEEIESGNWYSIPSKKRGIASNKIMIIAAIVVIVLVLVIGILPRLKKVAVEVSEIKAGKETVVGSASKNGWELNIPTNTFDEDVKLTMNVLSDNDIQEYCSDVLDIIGTAVQISVENEESIRLNEPVTITMQLPKENIPTSETIDSYLAGYWNGKSWEYIFPEVSDLYNGVITFETYHFSVFGTVKLTDEEKMKLYAQKMALQTWEDDKTKEEIAFKTEDMFKNAFEAMGVSDSSMQGKLFRSIMKEYDFGSLIVAAERGDAVDYGAKCAEMAANAIIKHYSLENNFVDNIAGKGAAAISGIGKAALQLKDGNYTDAAKELSSAFIGYFPYGRALQATVEIIDAGISTWKDYEIDAAYKSYQGLAPKGTYGFKINEGDWDTLCIQMRGALTRIHDEAKNNYCVINGIARSEFDKDKALAARIQKQAENNLKVKFEKRLASENEIKAKQVEYQKLIEGFQRDGLLTRGENGFGVNDNIQDRLRTLFAVRNNILDMVGGEMPVKNIGESAEENLNSAIWYWIHYGPKNRADFYKWIREQGYIEEIKPKEEVFAWVLVDIEDFDSEEKWVITNEHQAYDYEYSYARGSYSAKTIYVGASDDWYNPPMIQGEALGVQAIFSTPPEIILPGDTVSLTLSLSVTENSVSFFRTFSGSANATFDEPGIEAGYGTGRSVSFYNTENEYYFSIGSANKYETINETITATAPTGSEGKRIALRTSFYMGVSMCTNFVYEWKAQ